MNKPKKIEPLDKARLEGALWNYSTGQTAEQAIVIKINELIESVNRHAEMLGERGAEWKATTNGNIFEPYTFKVITEADILKEIAIHNEIIELVYQRRPLISDMFIEREKAELKAIKDLHAKYFKNGEGV